MFKSHSSLKKMTPVILTSLLLLCAATGLSGCSSANVSTGGRDTPTGTNILRVGVRSDISGFGFLNEETGKYYGLEIDIANELADRLGYLSTSFRTVTPDTRKNMLMNGKVDCVIACYSISDTRLENFDFSPPYYEDASVIMVEDSALFSDNVANLEGHTFGTLAGSNTASQLSIKLAEIGFSSGEVVSANEDNTDVWFDTYHLVQLPTYYELSEALESGEIDAMCADGSIIQMYEEDGRSVLSNLEIETQDYGVATQKDSALSEPVSETIQEMLDDGTIASLIDKWGFSEGDA